MPKFIDFTGRRFHRLTVARRGEDYRTGIPRWICRCDCGSEVLVRAGALKDGTTKSCGCLNVDVHRQMCLERNTTHGLSKTPTYDTWVNMRSRCESPNATAYPKYGAKGICVCDRWQTFENFLADMSERPSPEHSIDRIDNSKGYEPGNCRWVATMREQQNNRTNNHRLTFRGQTHSVMEWSRRTGIQRQTIENRLGRLGWSIADALTVPPDYGNKPHNRH